MVLRCSLLGHDYGESEVEREREERGSEVVVTVEEYEECVRCGERNVISENTEVTSLSTATAADSLPDDPDTTVPTDSDEDAVETPPEAPADTDTEVEFSDDEDDAEFIDADDDTAVVDDDTDTAAVDGDADTAEPTAAADDESESESEADEIEVPTDDHGEPVTDDGEILEDEEPAVDRDRDHGEWPDSDDVGPPVGAENDPETWPDDGGPAETDAVEADAETEADADEPIDDAVVLEDDSDSVGKAGESGAAADARSVTAAPPNAPDGQQPQDGDGGSEPTGSGTGIERATAAPTPGQQNGPASEDRPSEFYCPRCEYVASGDRGSLRAGDICPECRKGYLGERDRR